MELGRPTVKQFHLYQIKKSLRLDGHLDLRLPEE